ncbi:ABC transporter permease [Beijerinckia sp. L45]|uniref:ABC transporter permease n=1 Tax=Beijerinckia sp. L45 TaxID=1641855 RepID=UPI00131AFB0F|nr:ABC transporter permease [Beijerinckia sp. L45]
MSSDTSAAPAPSRTHGVPLKKPSLIDSVVRAWSTELQILVGIVVLALAFAWMFPDSFSTSGTMMNMARVAGILLVVSIGQSFVLIVGGFDISVGATMGLVSIVVSLLLVGGTPIGAALPIGLAVGAIVGFVNGIGVAFLRITPFVMTLGMLTFAKGLADELGDGGTITRLPSALAYFGRRNWGVLPSSGCIAAIVLAVAWFVLQRCRAGLYLFAIGGSRETTRVAGVRVAAYEIIAYTICGLLAGLGGIMLTSRVSVGQGSLGQGYELLSIATAVIGGVAIGGGVGRLTGVLLGVLLITILTTGLDIAGVNPFIQQMITGIVLIIAVVVSQAPRLSLRGIASLLRNPAHR